MSKQEPTELAVLGSFNKSDTGKTLVRLIQFPDGNMFVDIRKFYKKDGEWKPTSKGISIQPDDLHYLPKIEAKAKRAIAKLEAEAAKADEPDEPQPKPKVRRRRGKPN